MLPKFMLPKFIRNFFRRINQNNQNNKKYINSSITPKNKNHQKSFKFNNRNSIFVEKSKKSLQNDKNNNNNFEQELKQQEKKFRQTFDNNITSAELNFLRSLSEHELTFQMIQSKNFKNNNQKYTKQDIEDNNNDIEL